MNVAVFGMDPGGHTGLAWGVFDPTASAVESVANRMDPTGSLTVEGNEYEQIREICACWQKFLRSCVLDHCIPPEQVRFCAEDFIPKLGGITGKEVISPVRILWGVIGFRMGQAAEFKRTRRVTPLVAPPIVLQTASQANTKTSAADLKEADVWVKGKEHERSAWKHVFLYIRNYQKAVSTVAKS